MRVKDEAKLTVEDFVELSWWGMDDKVGDYAYLQRQRKEKRTGLELIYKIYMIIKCIIIVI